MVDSAPVDSPDSITEPELQYRAVEPWAIVAVILGLFAPAALAAPVLWFVPILGLLASATALRKISRESRRSGRALALVGLALATFFLVAAIAQSASTQWLLIRQARPVADQFVEFLLQGSPEKALLLHLVPEYRHPIDEGLWSYYRHNDEARADLRKFVHNPTIRLMLALGNRAQVRYYKTASLGTDNGVGLVDLWYTVTFTDAGGRKKTYVVSLLMERRPIDDPDLNPWRVRDFSGGIDPHGR
jgi:hypothetical protein